MLLTDLPSQKFCQFDARVISFSEQSNIPVGMFRVKIEPVFKTEQARDDVCLTSPTNFEINQQSRAMGRNSEKERTLILNYIWDWKTGHFLTGII